MVAMLLQLLSFWKLKMPYGAHMLNLKLEHKISTVAKVIFACGPLCDYLPARFPSTYSLLSLLNYSLFLVKADHPTLLHRLVGVKFASKAGDSEHQVDTEFLKRQLLWQTFTDFVSTVLPAWRKANLTSSLSFRSLPPSRAEIHYSTSPCPNCDCCDIAIPCKVDPCGHTHCYPCAALMASGTQKCKLCGVHLC